MPGVFGFTQKSVQPLNKLDALGKLNIHTNNSYHIRKDYINDSIANSIVSFDFMKSYNLHYEINNLEIWIYGDPLIDGYTGEKAIQQVAKLAAQSFPDFSKIAAIDELFTIIILHKTANKLFIIGDRNGLSHLYYGVFNGQLVWGSELRAFLTKSINTTIRNKSVTTFLELGYLIGDNTWFNEVKLLPPASYLEWDLEEAELKQITPYWSHKQLNAESISKDESKIVADLAELLAEVVSKRVAKDERIGITLSGGQDSRAIFANIPYRENGLVAITRGIRGCGDIKLASQVVKLRKDCTHIIKEMNENNWLNGRVDAIIATSGEKDFFNMNALGSLPMHKNHFDINLDGAGGDGIFGGGHLKYENKANAENALKDKYLKSMFSDNNTLRELYEYYEHIGSDQYFYTYQRVRRFTIFGSILGHDYGIISRFPFLDHQLQEYLFLLPKKTDFGRLYNKMLIKYFPEYFVKIDNLNTGSRLFVSSRLNYLSRVFRYAQSKAGFEKYRTRYHNYPYWIKNHNEGLLDQYILSKELKLYQYADPQPIKKAIDDFSKTGERSGTISRLITVNVFLEHYSR
ncbi:asparagine synthase-related protein [Agriterribacter sp.]|uniref:asparagine synthase-related protein n=1 Tax=Agriterribacter sp. TaxID=2821509 RepID=UPI002B6BD3BB|nr:asparagine synthase-related protein [Agriterribacter sp.]HTN08994.1 asparagine synthase-related protein [Agriterribacter sp.]